MARDYVTTADLAGMFECSERVVRYHINLELHQCGQWHRLDADQAARVIRRIRARRCPGRAPRRTGFNARGRRAYVSDSGGTLSLFG